jgi:hypothetical protein
MAIAKIGTDTSATGNTLPGVFSSLSHTLVAGTLGHRKVIVYIIAENGDAIDVSGVTYGGNAMTLSVGGSSATSGFRQYSSVWFIDEANLPANGARTVAVTFTGTNSSAEYSVYCAAYEGIAQGAASATDIDAQTSGATITSTIPALASTGWAFSTANCGNTGSFAHGQSQVELYDFSDASSQHSVAEKRGGSGETALTSTFTGTVNRLQRLCAVWDEGVTLYITLVTPDDPLRMDEPDVVITGGGFEASQGAGEVTISDNAVTGSGTVVDVSAAVTSWDDGEIDLNFGNLSQATLDALHSLGPGDMTRYIHVENDSAETTGGYALHLMRPIAIGLSASAYIAVSGENTTAQLAAPSEKTTGDFGGGRIQDDENPTDAVDLDIDEYREDEWCLVALAASVYTYVYQLRVLINDQEIDTYTVDPRWTIIAVERRVMVVT